MDSWTKELETLYTNLQVSLADSPNVFLENVFLYSTLKTMTLSCFDEDSFIPIDPGEVLQDILGSDPPDSVEEVLAEAPILAIIVDTNETDAIIERFDDYLDIALGEGDAEVSEAIAGSVVNGVSNLLESGSDSILDDSYDLLGNVEATLACSVGCGEDGLTVESDLVTVGAQSSTIEQLASQPISLGDTGASFLLPSDLSELTEIFGEGACVFTGTSVVESVDGSTIPSASFSFYTIDCETGEREEVTLTIDGEFLIFLPLPEGFQSGEDDEDNCGEEEAEVTCVSGDTLSNVNDSLGCRLEEIQETQIVCACTHLTAFSALFVDGGDGSGCGGGVGVGYFANNCCFFHCGCGCWSGSAASF